MENVFAQLPNDIIMRIIREADGGLSQHKINFKGVMSHFNSCVPVNFYPQVEQINDIMYYGYWMADPKGWNGCEDTRLSYETIFEDSNMRMRLLADDDHYLDADDLKINVGWEKIDIAFSKFLGYPVEVDDY